MTIANIQPMARLLLSVGIIFGVLAAVAATSSALFSDSATLENSTFATGSVDLLIAPETTNAPGTYVNAIQGQTFTGMLPGETETFTFWLKNDSSDTVSLDLGAIIDFVSTLPPVSTLNDDMSVGFACDVNNDGTAPPDGSIAAKPLSDWDDDPGATPGLGTLGPDDGDSDGTGTDEAKCTMTATLSETSTAEDNSITFDAEFVGTQEASESPTPTPTPSPTPSPTP